MNIKQAKQEIKDTIQAYLKKNEYGEYLIPFIRQRPVLLIGPPGIGKTQIMEQVARECRIGLVSYTITHHTRQSAIGLPLIEKRTYAGRPYSVTEYTMSEIVAAVYRQMEQTGLKEGILFIDEINCVSETLAPMMLQFLQYKSFGSHKIPEGWIIAAAGNPPEYNKSVREFDVVTLDRLRLIPVEPDLEAWNEYAEQAGIHQAVRSYLQVKPGHFCRIETTVDGKRFATPRGWEDLSELLAVYESLGKKITGDVVMEYIQFPKIAKDFANYLELHTKYRSEYQPEEILDGVIRPAVLGKLRQASFDERISAVGLLSAALNNHFRAVWEQARVMELVQQGLREFHESAEESFAGFVYRFQQEQERNRENGLLSDGQFILIRRAWQYFNKYKEQTENGSGGGWERLKELFGEDSDSYEELTALTGKKLEAAFDFMEQAFADSQEFIIFLTTLNTGFYSVCFLAEYSCKRYFEYNKNLLFDELEKNYEGKGLNRHGTD